VEEVVYGPDGQLLTGTAHGLRSLAATCSLVHDRLCQRAPMGPRWRRAGSRRPVACAPLGPAAEKGRYVGPARPARAAAAGPRLGRPRAPCRTGGPSGSRVPEPARLCRLHSVLDVGKRPVIHRSARG
jgi:hypothetical protein